MSNSRMTADFSSPAVRRARILLLAILPLIALLIYLDGQRYDSGLLDFKKAGARLSPLMGLFPDQSAGLARQGEFQRFLKENLHEYVNGHAEYYLSAGFKELLVGEYGDAGAADKPRVVVDLFDMGKPLFAFGVLTGEGNNDGPEAGIGEMGFRDPRGLRFIMGPYYVKMTAFDDAVPLEEIGKSLVAAAGKSPGAMMTGFRFPEFGTAGATRFIKEKYRGLDFFNQVVERSFVWQGAGVQAFQAGGSKVESREIEERLTAFLQSEEIPVETVEKGGLTVHRVRDPYEGEWFFLRAGERLIGAFGLPLEDAWSPLQRFVGSQPGGESPPVEPVRGGVQ
ncbi:hypothetical protein SIID45300_00762 [Candidatus Magnetaquicoccaceae bacterium FCR-1]|uniref:Uncharacterized protein n=1 Tax=Candidatus Magnetaquiglobus chichijimensis TaxID=3141448 RepID=A0ABQ0C6D1_9PROT